MFGERPRPHGKQLDKNGVCFLLKKSIKQQCIWGKEQMNEDKSVFFTSELGEY